MSWIFHSSKKDVQQVSSEILFGVNLVVKKIEGDIIVEGRARTLNDLIRLKRLAEEILNQVIREYEDKRTSSASPRHR